METRKLSHLFNSTGFYEWGRWPVEQLWASKIYVKKGKMDTRIKCCNNPIISNECSVEFVLFYDDVRTLRKVNFSYRTNQRVFAINSYTQYSSLLIVMIIWYVYRNWSECNLHKFNHVAFSLAIKIKWKTYVNKCQVLTKLL